MILNKVASDQPHIVLLADGLNMGGANRYCLELLAAIKRNYPSEVKVFFAALGSHAVGPSDTWLIRQARALAIDLHVIPMRNPFDVTALCRLSRLFVNFENLPVILHTQEYRSNVVGRIIKAIHRGILHVSTKHGFVVGSSRRASAYVAIDHHTARFTDHYIAVCRDTAERLLTDWHLPNEKVSTIPNGIDVSEGGVTAKNRRQDRHIPTLGYVGRLAEGKGIEDLVNAFRLIQQRKVANLRLVIAGDGPLKRSLVESTNGLPVSYITTLDEPEYAYAQLDVLILPSYSEGLPYSLLEAMRDGVPVIATAVGGIPDLVRDKVTGLLYPAGDVEALVSAIQTMFAESDKGAAFARRARYRISQDFSSATMACKTVALYRTLIERWKKQ